MHPVPNQSVQAPPGDEAPTDVQLVDRIRAGERRHFEVLVRRHNQRLYRIVRAILHDDGEAEDTVQFAHVAAYRQLDQFRGESSYATWLTRIAVNEAYGRIRRRKRHVLVSLEEAGGAATESRMASPEDETYQHELGRMLERNIDELPDTLRVVFVMREVEEIDTAETASTLGLSEAAVRVRLHRARNALQSSLTRAMTAAPAAFRFDGERCDRITRAVLSEIDPPGTA
ncbi:MAG TPA: RNA polymerase sigma factor [Kofleriaceae bacterium]|nr:RNA polymerase sigma factor [Kofleriaceae bacterium]